MRIAGPGGIDAFFTQLKDLWLERNPSVSTGQIPILHQPELQPVIPIPVQSQIDSQAEHEFIVRLAKDLDYLGVATDLTTLGPYIYNDLGKRFGRKVSNVRRSPFSELEVKNTNATKKAVRKVKQKAPVKRIVYLCSVCRKAGHTKINCPGVKTTKKVNYVYQNAEKDQVSWEPTEDSEELEIEYIFEEEVEEEPEIEYVLEEEVEEND